MCSVASHKILSKLAKAGVPTVAQCVMNLTSIHENACLIPGLARWVKYLALL